MNTPREYSFAKQLAMSSAPASNGDIEGILLGSIPQAAHARPAHVENDRRGTDWWVELTNGVHLSVDCKVRAQDWYRKAGKDDLALETWSVVESKKVGWTLDATKRTDYVLWLWVDTGRWVLVPFPMLQGVFRDKLVAWVKKYQVSRQFTPGHGGYHSECVFVPRRELWAAIYDKYGGAPQAQHVS